eukprot:Clim_evm7s253 gene=Clim_evmTU7s253
MIGTWVRGMLRAPLTGWSQTHAASIRRFASKQPDPWPEERLDKKLKRDGQWVKRKGSWEYETDTEFLQSLGLSKEEILDLAEPREGEKPKRRYKIPPAPKERHRVINLDSKELEKLYRMRDDELAKWYASDYARLEMRYPYDSLVTEWSEAIDDYMKTSNVEGAAQYFEYGDGRIIMDKDGNMLADQEMLPRIVPENPNSGPALTFEDSDKPAAFEVPGCGLQDIEKRSGGRDPFLPKPYAPPRIKRIEDQWYPLQRRPIHQPWQEEPDLLRSLTELLMFTATNDTKFKNLEEIPLEPLSFRRATELAELHQLPIDFICEDDRPELLPEIYGCDASQIINGSVYGDLFPYAGNPTQAVRDRWIEPGWEGYDMCVKEALEPKLDEEPRRNPTHIQMLPTFLRRAAFGPGHQFKVDGEDDPEKHRKYRERTFKYFPESIPPPMKIPNIKMPGLEGNNIGEHFFQIGERYSKPMRWRIEDLIRNDAPEMPTKWAQIAGWTRYNKDGSWSHFDELPREKAIIFDVEVMMAEGQGPALAVALSKDYWYSWCSEKLAMKTRPTVESFYELEAGQRFRREFDLIRLGEHSSQSDFDPEDGRNECVVIGHNVTFDRARVHEEYNIYRSRYRFLDTLSMHFCVGGLSTQQIALKAKHMNNTVKYMKPEEEAEIAKRTFPFIGPLKQRSGSQKPIKSVSHMEAAAVAEFGHFGGADFELDIDAEGLADMMMKSAEHGLESGSESASEFQEPALGGGTSLGEAEESDEFASSAEDVLDLSRTEDAIEEVSSEIPDLEKKKREIHNPELYDEALVREMGIKPNTNNDDHGPWADASSGASLAAIYELYCGEQLKKETRDLFVDGHVWDVWDNFQKAMKYCASDVKATHEIMQVMWPLWITKCPHPVSLVGLTELASAYLPINEAWDDYIMRCSSLYEALMAESDELLRAVALKVVREHWHDRPENDPWLKNLNWDTDTMHYTQAKFNLDGTFKAEPKLRSPMENRLPRWFRTLDRDGLNRPVVTLQTHNLPYLMKLRYMGSPLKYDARFGWYWEKRAQNRDEYERITHQDPYWVSRLSKETDLLMAFRFPHKEGMNKNVAKPLSGNVVSMIEKGDLTSDNAQESLIRVVEIANLVSFWEKFVERLEDQFVIWNLDNRFKMDRDNFEGIDPRDSPVTNKVSGAILPSLIPHGTVTRRAVEPLWMTATAPKFNRIGSELKCQVIAPPGWNFVGADVDSQELWIASIIGDSWDSRTSGVTPFSWMTLQGKKSNKTDLHSVTAALAGISRDEAKILNYARIYGAGPSFAVQLLRRFNTRASKDEIKARAEKLYSETKGTRYFLDGISRTYIDEDFFPDPGETILDEPLDMKYEGGTESQMFTALENIAMEHGVTPVLDVKVSNTLEPERLTGVLEGSFSTSRINWVVQSSAVDYLHLMLVNMRWLFEEYDIQGRFAISIHDEVRFLCHQEDSLRCAMAMQATNLHVRAMFAFKLGMQDLPLAAAFFSGVDIDHCIRKEPDDDALTPSNPYPVPHGVSLNVHELCAMTGGSLVSKEDRRRHELNVAHRWHQFENVYLNTTEDTRPFMPNVDPDVWPLPGAPFKLPRHWKDMPAGETILEPDLYLQRYDEVLDQYLRWEENFVDKLAAQYAQQSIADELWHADMTDAEAGGGPDLDHLQAATLSPLDWVMTLSKPGHVNNMDDAGPDAHANELIILRKANAELEFRRLVRDVYSEAIALYGRFPWEPERFGEVLEDADIKETLWDAWQDDRLSRFGTVLFEHLETVKGIRMPFNRDELDRLKLLLFRLGYFLKRERREPQELLTPTMSAALHRHPRVNNAGDGLSLVPGAGHAPMDWLDPMVDAKNTAVTGAGLRASREFNVQGYDAPEFVAAASTVDDTGGRICGSLVAARAATVMRSSDAWMRQFAPLTDEDIVDILSSTDDDLRQVRIREDFLNVIASSQTDTPESSLKTLAPMMEREWDAWIRDLPLHTKARDTLEAVLNPSSWQGSAPQAQLQEDQRSLTPGERLRQRWLAMRKTQLRGAYDAEASAMRQPLTMMPESEGEGASKETSSTAAERQQWP